MERIPLGSSVFAAVRYDPATETLEVEFRNGRVYEYNGVAPHTVEQLMNAESKGQFFNADIRDAHSCVMVG